MGDSIREIQSFREPYLHSFSFSSSSSYIYFIPHFFLLSRIVKIVFFYCLFLPFLLGDPIFANGFAKEERNRGPTGELFPYRRRMIMIRKCISMSVFSLEMKKARTHNMQHENTWQAGLFIYFARKSRNLRFWILFRAFFFRCVAIMLNLG